MSESLIYSLIRTLSRAVLRLFYRVRIHGLEHFEGAGERVLIVANHTSFLDAVLLAAFFPLRLTFAIDTFHAQRWYGRIARLLVDLFPMNPTNPLATKSLIKYLKEDHRAVIFPEGRITVTGALMKVYQGPGLIADKSQAMVLPVRIEGAQYTPFSRMKGRIRIRWFPRISLTVLPPRRLSIEGVMSARQRRARAGQLLSELMTDMMYATSHRDSTLPRRLLDARRVHGGDHVIVDDIQRSPQTYDDFVMRALILGRAMARDTRRGEIVGILLPNMATTCTAFFGLQFYSRVPAMLNFTVGARGLRLACETANLNVVYTSRRFEQTAKLGNAVKELAERVKVIYLEDVADSLTLLDKIRGWVAASLTVRSRTRRASSPHDPAVVLFTSGSERTPKGVVLSHSNLLANLHQLGARVDFTASDVILNALPMFHSFGLTAGTILPLLHGMKTFFYPSPLHYRVIPEIAYDINATILFGTNTFLSGYARYAHPYDFYSMRYVFAGAEKLKEETRRLWEDKFGVRIFEGYGATETSPALAINTALAHKAGTVGRFLPGIDWKLETVPGVTEGGRLHVKGQNVMLGYLLHERPGALVAPRSVFGQGWYDTGDIVSLDSEGFVTIRGRAKRFAKIGGEMISLSAVESIVSQVWPDAQHAVVAVPDAQKGEQLALLTTQAEATRAPLIEHCRKQGIGELHVPRRVAIVRQLPVLGTGKVDYAAVLTLFTHPAPVT